MSEEVTTQSFILYPQSSGNLRQQRQNNRINRQERRYRACEKQGAKAHENYVTSGRTVEQDLQDSWIACYLRKGASRTQKLQNTKTT